ncbi:DAK2 domain-containing protein [Paenibacillus sp. y28]|uniref:DAK2 domain-containing protein n=1 Tax=Paenibacillus sp. y28 TaxID=3129110 RepID=UPI00301753FD
MLGKRLTTLDGTQFAHLVLTAANHLGAHAEDVNAMNVFPVPDGDTGTNMSLTLTFGAGELRKKGAAHLGTAAETLSKGLLMGARGNSGVILSQLFRGMAKSLHDQEAADPLHFAAALQAGVDTAYQAVVRPVEGTILSVAREAAKHAAGAARRCTDMDELMREVLSKAREALARTPDQLPVLKQVGVVDAGGQGLVYIYEAFAAALAGLAAGTRTAAELSLAWHAAKGDRGAGTSARTVQRAQAKLETEAIEHQYDMEFFIRLAQHSGSKPFSEAALRRQLERIGDSVIVIRDGEEVKVHVHSSAPGEVLNYCLTCGELVRIAILNMREQHRELLQEQSEQTEVSASPAAAGGTAPPIAAVHPGNTDQEAATGTGQQQADKETETMERYGFVAVASGEGLTSLFHSLGAVKVISGGQSMNPSTEDLVRAAEGVHAENVFILPNNSNIILAARQAEQLSDRRIIVVPTKTVPQGMAALIAFQDQLEPEQNLALMLARAAEIKTGQITTAVRDTEMDGLIIEQGDTIGVLDSTMAAADKDIFSACCKLLEAMLEDGGEVVTVLTGQDADPVLTERLEGWLEKSYPEVDVETYEGGQPVYAYLFSVE